MLIGLGGNRNRTELILLGRVRHRGRGWWFGGRTRRLLTATGRSHGQEHHPRESTVITSHAVSSRIVARPRPVDRQSRPKWQKDPVRQFRQHVVYGFPGTVVHRCGETSREIYQ